MSPYHFSIIHSLISSIPVMPRKWDLGHVPIIILKVIPLFPIVLFWIPFYRSNHKGLLKCYFIHCSLYQLFSCRTVRFIHSHLSYHSIMWSSCIPHFIDPSSIINLSSYFEFGNKYIILLLLMTSIRQSWCIPSVGPSQCSENLIVLLHFTTYHCDYE